MNFIKQHSIFLFLLLCTCVLRFYPLGEYQFTFDELSGLDRTQFTSFSELIDKGVKIDAHPAFVQVLLYVLTQCFGYTTWIIKLPFLLFSLGLIMYAYAFALTHFSKQSALLASAFFSFSLIFVFYAPIARMYISGAFFSMALLYYFFKIFFNEDLRLRNYVLLGFFAYLSALNQHLNALFALSVCVSGLFFITKKTSKAYLITCALVVLAYLPNLPITWYQFNVPGIGRENGGWLERAEFSVIFDLLKVLFGTGRSYVILLFLIGLSYVLNKKIIFSKKQLYLLVIFSVNYVIIYVYSLVKSPIYQHSVMLFASTALIMAMCATVEFKTQALFHLGLFALCSVLIYKTYFKKDYLHQSVKTVYEYQFERSCHYKKIYGNAAVYPIFCDADTLMKKIYFKKYQCSFDCKISSDSVISTMENRRYERQGANAKEEVSTLRLFSEFVSTLKADYLLISSSMPVQQAIIKNYFPYLIENTQTQGIHVKVYSKRASDSNLVVADDALLNVSDLRSRGNFVYSYKQREDSVKSGVLLQVDSLNEFPLEAKADVNAIFAHEGEVLLLSAELGFDVRKGEVECCVSVNEKETNTALAYAAKRSSDFVSKNESRIQMYAEYFNGNVFKTHHDRSVLTAYLWNKNKKSMEVRDFRLQIVNHWPMKWQFWD